MVHCIESYFYVDDDMNLFGVLIFTNLNIKKCTVLQNFFWGFLLELCLVLIQQINFFESFLTQNIILLTNLATV